MSLQTTRRNVNSSAGAGRVLLQVGNEVHQPRISMAWPLREGLMFFLLNARFPTLMVLPGEMGRGRSLKKKTREKRIFDPSEPWFNAY